MGGNHVNLGQKAFQRSDNANQEATIMVSQYVSTHIKFLLSYYYGTHETRVKNTILS